MRQKVDNPSFADRFVTVIVDASFCSNTKSYGWAVWMKHGNPPSTTIVSGRGLGHRNSTTSEILAIDMAISIIKGLKPQMVGKRIVIQSDCMAAMEARPLSGVSLELCADVYYKHVKAHSGTSTPRTYIHTLIDIEAKKQMRRQRRAVQWQEKST